MKSSEIIKAIKKQYRLTSDYQVHKKTGWTRQKVSNYVNDKRLMDDDAVITAAELLDMDPGYLLAKVAAERSKRSHTKEIWEQIAKQFTSTAAAIALCFMGILAPFPGEAQAAERNATPSNVYYVNSRRRWWEQLKDLFVTLAL